MPNPINIVMERYIQQVKRTKRGENAHARPKPVFDQAQRGHGADLQPNVPICERARRQRGRIASLSRGAFSHRVKVGNRSSL